MPQDLTDDKSTLVQEMAWCSEARSHYLTQCWPRSPTPYGVTRPRWVKLSFSLDGEFAAQYKSTEQLQMACMFIYHAISERKHMTHFTVQINERKFYQRLLCWIRLGPIYVCRLALKTSTILRISANKSITTIISVCARIPWQWPKVTLSMQTCWGTNIKYLKLKIQWFIYKFYVNTNTDYLRYSDLHEAPWTKWLPFLRRSFQMHFHEWKVLYFDQNFNEVCS